jgi:ATP-binding cassette subfamily F protein 3
MAYIAQQRQFNRERNIIAAESRLKLLDKMEKFERPGEAPSSIKLKFTAEHSSGNDVLRVSDLSMEFGENKLFSNLNFLIKKDERVFIIGPNGCGKSTLIKLIMGQLSAISGHIEAGYNVQVGYYDQQNQNLTEENTVIEELWSAYPTQTETFIRTTLASFRFFGDDVFKSVAVLSGGERARLTLAKLILSKMNLLVLDEPTNHLDIDSKEALEGALSNFNGTILIVSHDRYFINKLATRIIELKPGDEFKKDYLDCYIEKTGDAYNEYLSEKTRLSKLCLTDEGGDLSECVSNGREQYLKEKENIAAIRRAERRNEKLQNEAKELEKKLEEIAKALYGEAGTDYKKAAELTEEQERVEERLLEIYEEIGV